MPIKDPEKRKEYKAQWYLKNKERVSEEKKKKYEENKDVTLERNKRWRDENPNYYEKSRDKRIEWTKKWKENNPEKIRKYKEENKDKIRANTMARIARKRNTTPLWIDRKEIQKIYKEARLLEIQDGIKRHIDHIIPLIHPLVCGLHVHNNLQILTESENCSKQNKFAPFNLDGDIV